MFLGDVEAAPTGNRLDAESHQPDDRFPDDRVRQDAAQFA
jgi:hypothetical protein